MDRNKFLKVAQRKRFLNRKKAEPDMRIAALLESTCKRLRSELKLEHKRERAKSEEYASSKKMRFDEENFLDEDTDSDEEECDVFDDEEDDLDDEDLNEEIDVCGDEEIEMSCPSDYPSSSSSSTPFPFEPSPQSEKNCSDKSLVDKVSSLWDDPQQVEAFFREVDSEYDPRKHYYENLDLDKELFNPVRSLSVSDSYINKCVSTYNFQSFTMEFDNMYRELFQSISVVESLVSTCQQKPVTVSDRT